METEKRQEKNSNLCGGSWGRPQGRALILADGRSSFSTPSGCSLWVSQLTPWSGFGLDIKLGEGQTASTLEYCSPFPHSKSFKIRFRRHLLRTTILSFSADPYLPPLRPLRLNFHPGGFPPLVAGAHGLFPVLPDRSMSAGPSLGHLCLLHSTPPSDLGVSLDTVARIRQQFCKFVSYSVTGGRFLQSIFFPDSEVRLRMGPGLRACHSMSPFKEGKDTNMTLR